jgi:hypothetical protein
MQKSDDNDHYTKSKVQRPTQLCSSFGLVVVKSTMMMRDDVRDDDVFSPAGPVR